MPIISVIGFFATLTSRVLADPVYTVAAIPIPAGLTNTNIDGINDLGQVVGYGNNNSIIQSFISTTQGSMVVTPPSGWDAIVASGINDSGAVVGTGVNSSGVNQGFTGTTSGITPFPTPNGYTGDALEIYGINDNGQLVGVVLGSQVFIGTAAGLTTTLQTEFTLFSDINALSINDSGQIAAWGLNGDVFTAFVSTASGDAQISPLNGWCNISALGINDSGQVVGNGFTFTPSPIGNLCTATQAYIGTAAGIAAIPLPVGATVNTVGDGSVNNSGTVVGYSDAGGWIWNAANGTQLLNLFVPAGWNITDAISISNNGLILAEGSYNGGATEYVELATSPEPFTGLLLGSGLLLLSCVRARRRSR
ncbi:MAG TPA: hypothetical protein VGL82_01795 [Bryobacteraceae bacterium]